MVKNYFTVAWRNLTANKAYSALNILGLSIGMAVALLIGLWVSWQFSYDRFLPDYRQTYQVRFRSHDNGVINTQEWTCLPLAEVMKRDVPEIKHVAQTNVVGEHGIVVGDKKFYLSGLMATGDFLKVFPYPLLEGNAEQALKDPYSILLTESTARALFGKEEPLNKTIRIDNNHDLRVTGVLKDVPANSTLQFTWVVPFDYFIAANDWVKGCRTDWGMNSFETYVRLREDVSYSQAEPKMRGLLMKYAARIYTAGKVEVFMQPMKDWHLYSNFKNGVAAGGFIDYVKMFSLIGILVLVIACINFMNLSTARSSKRAREVGIRKAIGSLRRDLILQFLMESFVVTFAAFGLSLLLVQLVLPAFDAFTKTTVTIPYDSWIFWAIMLAFVLLTGLLAGSRPAFYLSSFKPVKVLKGTLQVGRSASLPRKILVVLQFTSSIALIISTIIIYEQLDYARRRPTGFDTDRLMMTDNTADLGNNYVALKQDMLQSGVVSMVTKSSGPATDLSSHVHVDEWQGKLPGEIIGGMATVAVSDTDYFRTVGMHILKGKNFDGYLGSDTLGVILNEAAVKRLRFKEPLDQTITWGIGKQQVIGVVKDALMDNPYAQAEPTFFVYIPGWSNSIMYRIAPGVNTRDAIAKLTPLFNKYNPTYPYLYKFADVVYQAKFDLETLIGSLAGIFAGLAIIISCLGLFGLAAYMAEQRTKEIGIRKVLGASVPQVWMLLSTEFIGLVAISCVIASPIAFYFLSDWLLKYDYRITIGPGVFLLAAAVALFITVITISFQSIRAALMNPVKSLRSE
jgi:putative ABC transport system permease protein